MAVDIGSEAIDREQHTGDGNTMIEPNSQATKAGVITQIDIWMFENATTVKVATFFKTNGNTFTARDSANLGGVLSGAKREITQDSVGAPLAIAVQIGDYIGLYSDDGDIEIDLFGAGNGWVLAGDQTGCVATVFGEHGGLRTYSLGGYISSLYQPRPAGMAVGTGLIF